MPDVFPDNQKPEDYFKKMGKRYVFADIIFLCGAAVHFQRDIIIVHLHLRTVENGLFNWIRGGSYGSDISATGCPIFLGNNYC